MPLNRHSEVGRKWMHFEYISEIEEIEIEERLP